MDNPSIFVRNMNGHFVIPLTKDLFIGADGKIYKGNIDDPDDCPQCKWQNKGCPTGRLYPVLGTHLCNVGLFEKKSI